MNDTFSFKRFGLLLRKFAKENRHTYILYLTSLFGILFVIFGITILNILHWRYSPDTIEIIFMVGLIFTISIFSASYYGFFNNKAKGIRFLNIPSSHTEKIVLGFLVTQVVCFLSFVICFVVIDHIMCGFYNQFHKMPENTPPEAFHFFVANPLRFSDATVKGTILFALAISSICHFGSLCFEKNAFVKTALCILIIGAIIFYYNFYSMSAMIPGENMPGGKFYNEGMRLGSSKEITGFIGLPGGWDKFMYWSLPGILYIFFWIASYFKLKEKQV